MFLRILGESFARHPRRKVITGAALVLGMAVATATLTVSLDVGDRLAREFRSLGANLLVTPQSDTLPLEIGGVDYRLVDEGAYLREEDVGKLRTVFWRLNIIGFTPFLEFPVEAQFSGRGGAAQARLIGTWYEHSVAVPDGTTYATGARVTHPWWQVEGQWFADGRDSAVIGVALARHHGVRIGDTVRLTINGTTRELRVSGVVTTGDTEEEALLVPLGVAQQLVNRPGQFRRMLVSALTKPEDDFARRDPAAMTPVEYDRWYCTPYISSIAYQIGQVLPGTEVRAIRRVAESEGHVLTRVSGLMWLVTLAALLAAGLAVGATSAATVIERRTEVGLMKALGAGNGAVAALFLGEQIFLAILGGSAGFVLGSGLAKLLGQTVFGVQPDVRLILLPVILALAAIVALAGSAVPLLRAARFAPAPILRGE